MSKTRVQRIEAKLRAKIENLKAQIEQRDTSIQKPVLQRKIDGLNSRVSQLEDENAELKSRIAALIA